MVAEVVSAGRAAAGEDGEWQRLDKWLWCARFLKARAECARLVAAGGLRVNRQPTDKPHARLRPGDVITLPWRGDVRVIEVLALAARRGPAPEARALYREIGPAAGVPCEPAGGVPCETAGGVPCETRETAAYAADERPGDPAPFNPPSRSTR